MTVTSIVANLKDGYLDKQIGLLKDVAADIHQHPEIRFTEHHASARLTAELETAGFAVQRGFAGLETSFVATWHTPDADESTPNIAIFCEYDALEGLGHGCGHNLIAACGLGASLLVKDALAGVSGTPARLTVVGSPGEEGAAGKVPMIEAGVLDGVDLAMMIHPGPADVPEMTSLSRVALDVTFTGRASHASASPESGINALDASTLSLTAIGLLRQQLPDDVRVHAIVTDGGQAPNVIPETSAIRCFVRAADNHRLLNEVVPKVKNCFRGAGLATGAEVDIAENTPAYLSMDSSPGLNALASAAFQACGRAVNIRETGAGSTDMGNVSQVVPSIHPIISLGEGPTPHTREFAETAGGPASAAVIADGAVILAATTLHVFQNPELSVRFNTEFAQT